MTLYDVFIFNEAYTSTFHGLCKSSSVACLDQGNYTEWTNWSECSATCGGGAQIRSRTCTNPPPKVGGKDCKETIGPAQQSRQCDTGPCRKCL